MSAQDPSAEYQVKAAFLFHFAQLVEWPSDRLGTGQSISLCLFDDEPYRKELESTVEGKRVGDGVFQAREIHQLSQMTSCNIVFLSRDEVKRQKAVLDHLHDLPVLTVGETDDFLAEGGMIRFHLEADRVRFNINLNAANSGGIRISSRLLLLASHVLRSSGEDSGGM